MPNAKHKKAIIFNTGKAKLTLGEKWLINAIKATDIRVKIGGGIRFLIVNLPFSPFQIHLTAAEFAQDYNLRLKQRPLRCPPQLF